MISMGIFIVSDLQKKKLFVPTPQKVVNSGVIGAKLAWRCWSDQGLPGTAPKLPWLQKYLYLLMLLLLGVVSSLETDVAMTCVHVGSPSLPSSLLLGEDFFKSLKQVLFAFSQNFALLGLPFWSGVFGHL